MTRGVKSHDMELGHMISHLTFICLQSNVKLLSCKYFMHWWSWVSILACTDGPG